MDTPANPCCDTTPHTCVFDKALLAQQAGCECAQRRAIGERLLVECAVPVARLNCATLAALLHERARFALRLPAPGRPLIHASALRLQCGGLLALHDAVEGNRPGAIDGDDGSIGRRRDAHERAAGMPRPDVHRLVGRAQALHGSLTELPWPSIVAAMARWQPQRRRAQSP